ncbi:amidohydrolase family protein [Actinopolymorpha pittospori]|uniref:N-acetylglucosamine-6-phosphate deacetylase n=1 Tax=Actinopolymorpha pittospori TaxID=648752 RepID=A0A927N4Z1_9ACTN|nr:N-acetylglucosamine-6-phosphate deacetylase [Actinopolymorpha pittospori]
MSSPDALETSAVQPSALELSGRDPATGGRLTVAVRDGVVAEVHLDSADRPGDETPWLSPGLIDLQVNGYAGFDANDPTAGPEVIGALARSLFAVGVTTVVPTVVTASEEHILDCLRQVVRARADDPLVRHAIPFVHVEGPHLSEEDGPRGVHARDQVRPPDAAEFERWQQASEGLVGLVTMSPHFPDSTAYIAQLVSHGVRVAVGHTHATPEQIHAAADAGATLSTHLGNGAHAVLPRHPNYVWAQLADDRLSAGLIADGHHLPTDTLIAMLAAKGAGRAFLVSDATTLAGSPPGVYETPVGGSVELSADGRLSHVGTPYLAGAARSLTEGVAHLAGLGRHSLADALALASAVPGRICGGRGRLEVGAPADLVAFRWVAGDPTLTMERVLVGGTTVLR